MLPTCQPYHPSSELRSKPGCYPNLTPEQVEAAQQILSRLVTEGSRIDFGKDEVEFLKALRFLRARKFNVEQAMAMIRTDLAWRAERPNLVKLTMSEVLGGCDKEAFWTYFPSWNQGFDKQCRPVSYRCFGKLEVQAVLRLISMGTLVNYHAWETEQAMKLMGEKSKETGFNIETFVLVIDAAGWHMGLAGRDAYSFIKAMAQTDSAHFPERLGQLLIINAPYMLSIAWRVIQAFIDDVTKAKIRIMSTKEEWQV